MKKFILLLLITLTSSNHAHSEIYKYIDENGKTVYTDKKPDNKEQESVKLDRLNTSDAFHRNFKPKIDTPEKTEEKNRQDDTESKALAWEKKYCKIVEISVFIAKSNGGCRYSIGHTYPAQACDKKAPKRYEKLIGLKPVNTSITPGACGPVFPKNKYIYKFR